MLSCGILRGETSRTRLAPSGEESDTLTGLTGQSRSTTETPWIGIALTRWPDAFACTEERRVPAASRIAWKPFDVRVVENWHCSTEALGAGTRAHQIYGGGVSGILNRVGAHHAFPSQLGACKRMRREQDGLSLVAELHRLIICS